MWANLLGLGTVNLLLALGFSLKEILNTDVCERCLSAMSALKKHSINVLLTSERNENWLSYGLEDLKGLLKSYFIFNKSYSL